MVLPESPRWLIRARSSRPTRKQILRRIEDEVAKSTGRALPAVIPSQRLQESPKPAYS